MVPLLTLRVRRDATIGGLLVSDVLLWAKVDVLTRTTEGLLCVMCYVVDRHMVKCICHHVP